MCSVPGSAVTHPEPINIFTCTPNLYRWVRQVQTIRKVRWPGWFVTRVFDRESSQISLKRLNILYSAAWLRVHRFPSAPGWPREPRPYRWMIFCSNFGGGWDPYRQAFLDTLPQGIKTLWGKSTTYPGYPRRDTRYPTEDWLFDRLPTTQHYYYAYTGLGPNDVRAAVRLYREVAAFVLSTRPGAEQDPSTHAALRELVAGIQDSLQGLGPAHMAENVTFGPDLATGMSSFASLVPILPGREDTVRALLAALPNHQHSPFRRVEGTHFARLTVLDRRHAAFHPDVAIELRSSWLLFVADFDGEFRAGERSARRMDAGEVRRYAQSVDQVPELRQIWSHCYGFSEITPLEQILEPSVLERFVFFRDYPDVTLRQIAAALDVQRNLVRLLARQRLDSPAVVEAFFAHVRAVARQAA
jgi:hypothetical protein